MTDEVIYYRFRVRRGTAADLAAVNEPVLEGEYILELDTGRIKLGQVGGTTLYNDLPYLDFMFFLVAGGTADALTATLPIPEFDGMTLSLRADDINTGAVTFNGDPLTKFGGVALAAGDIAGAGHELLIRYVEATPGWELLNPAASGSGGSTSLEIDINQVGHGFVVGQAINGSSGTWIEADRTDDDKACDFIVSEVVDADNFKALLYGALTLTTGEWDAVTGDAGGLTPGEYYWLDSAGGLTATRPDTRTQCLLFALSATDAVVCIGDFLNLATTTVVTHSAAGTYAHAETNGQIVILVDTTAGNITIGLPPAANNTAIFHIKKTIAANNLTIDGNGAETIDGSATKVLAAQYASASLVSDGTKWHNLNP